MVITPPPFSIPVVLRRNEPSACSMGAGRKIALLAVHHVHWDGRILTGGAEKYILQTVAALLEAGARVHVGYSGDNIYAPLASEFQSGLTLEALNWISPELRGDREFSPRLIWQRRRWLRRTGADTLMVIQQASGATFMNALLAARSLGLRVVESIRQPPPEPLAPAARPRLRLIPIGDGRHRRQRQRIRRPASLCHAITFNSRSIADAYVRRFGIDPRRVRVIPNGEVIHADGCRSRQATGDRIVAVGRLTHAKGADTLLDAFARLAGHRPDVSLEYVGNGDLETSLRERARGLGLLDRVHFRGYERDRDLAFRNAQVCAHLSRRESMSNTVLEAMARGIPCVASDVGGMSELVRDDVTGLLVPPGNSEAAAAAIVRLLEEPGLADRLACNALAWSREHHDLRQTSVATARTILGIEGEPIAGSNDSNTPMGIRTPVAGMKSQCPSPLDDGGGVLRGGILR